MPGNDLGLPRARLEERGTPAPLEPTLAPDADNLVQAEDTAVTSVFGVTVGDGGQADDASPYAVNRKNPLSGADNGFHKERAKGFEPSTYSLGSKISRLSTFQQNPVKSAAATEAPASK